MKILITTLLGFIVTATQAQLPKADIIPTPKGNVTIQPVFHASLVLEFNKVAIYVDPIHGADTYKEMKKPDLVLITHIHGDHFDMKTLNGLDLSHATLLVPQSVADKMPVEWKNKIVVLHNGGNTVQHGIPITAIAMYNMPGDSTVHHPKGEGNGYVLNLGGKRFYISGDTEATPEMRSLKDIDVAFVCMNLPYTMDVEEAASGVLAFKPKIVYPYHYRTPTGFSDVAKFKSLVNAGNSSIDVRLRNWYPDIK
ncbi:MAG: MBL fold metallo-hydrolase [Bacteroidota bacterium]|nr:MBL fold metallo-hydrolase [Bacteroidota bacterium]